MTAPKISVIVPVFNTERYLQTCINSILAQTYTDFELLLINDGSTDSSGIICDQNAMRDPRIKVFHKENTGVSSTRNMGIDLAQGEWLIFIDSDDWINAGMFQDMLGKAVSDAADLIYSDMVVVRNGQKRLLHIAQYDSIKANMLNNFIKSSFSTIVGSLVKKTLYCHYDIRFPVDVSYSEDFHVAVRLLLYSNKTSYLETPHYHYNRNEHSTSYKFCSKHYRSVQWVYEDIIDRFRNEGQYEYYAEALSWRLLNSTQELVLNKKMHKEFLAINHDSYKYIWSCPYLNTKIKIIMSCLSYNMSGAVSVMLWMREFKLKIEDVLRNMLAMN